MQHTALVIVDMQKDFVLPEILPLNQRAFEIIPIVKRALNFARGKQMPIFYIGREYKADGSNVEFMRVAEFMRRPRAIPGTTGCEIVDELSPQPGDYRIIKPRFSAFMGSEFDFILRRLKIQKLIVCGTQLPNCVRATVYDALALDYEVVLLTDAVAARTEEVYQANLVDLKNIGAVCISTQEFINQD